MKIISVLAILASLLMLYIGCDLIGSSWSNERAIGGTLIYVWLVPFASGLIGLAKGLRA